MTLKHILILTLLILSGCSQHQVIPKTNDQVSQCIQDFELFDRVIDRAGTRNAGETLIAGYPFLRTNRLLDSFDPSVLTPKQRGEWLTLMAELDRAARYSEFHNLSGEEKLALTKEPAHYLASVNACRDQLITAIQTKSDWVEHLNEATVPDDYVTWQRVVGLYYLTGLPLSKGVSNLHAEINATYAIAEKDLPVEGELLYLKPPMAKPKVSAGQLKAIMARSLTPDLGVPVLSVEDRTLLFAYYAPEWLLDVVEPNDKIGKVHYQQGVTLAQVDVAEPVVYRRVSHTRFGDQVLLQLNYVVWFPARTEQGRFDILGGHMDGIMWRVTLDSSGQPLVYDTAHNCGCYHLFYPTHQAKFIAEDSGIYTEPPMSPSVAPSLSDEERIIIRVAHLSHFVDRVSNRLASPVKQQTTYTFADYEQLETLPTSVGSQSLFGADGLIKGTERAERYMLWMMGVKSPGAMRQWGRHATAFLERRHFDDARLLENIILIKD